MEGNYFTRIVSQQAQITKSQVNQNLRPDAILSQVCREAQPLVGLHGVQSPVLQLIGLQLAQEANTPSLLSQIEQYSSPLLGDHTQCSLKLVPTVAAQGPQSIPGQTFRVDADQHWFLPRYLAHDQSHGCVFVGDQVLVGHGGEVAESGGQSSLGHSLHQPLMLAPIFNQISNGDNLYTVLCGELLQTRDTGHRPILIHDLADYRCWVESCQFGQIHRGLGLACAHQHPPLFDPQGKQVPWTDQVLRLGLGIEHNPDRVRPVVSRDTGSDPLPGIHGYSEGRAEAGGVVLYHHGDLKLIQALTDHGQTDKPPAVLSHEIDRLRRCLIGGNAQITLILPTLIINDDDHLPLHKILNCLFNRSDSHTLFSTIELYLTKPCWARKSRVRAPLDGCPSPSWLSNFSTYLANMSTSRLTCPPTCL